MSFKQTRGGLRRNRLVLIERFASFQRCIGILITDRRNYGVQAMFKHACSAVLLIFLLGAMGCSFSSAQKEQEEENPPGGPTISLPLTTIDSSSVELSSLDRGAYGSLFEGQQRVLRSQDELTSFWSSIHADTRDAPQVPEIDFSEKLVAAVVLGERRTGGYAVEISRAIFSRPPNHLRIHFTEYEPGENCFVSEAITAPYHLVVMDPPDLDTEVEFVENDTETRRCD